MQWFNDPKLLEIIASFVRYVKKYHFSLCQESLWEHMNSNIVSVSSDRNAMDDG